MKTDSRLKKFLPYLISVAVHGILLLWGWQTFKPTSFNVHEEQNSLEIVSIASQQSRSQNNPVVEEKSNTQQSNLLHAPIFSGIENSPEELNVSDTQFEKSQYEGSKQSKNIFKKSFSLNEQATEDSKSLVDKNQPEIVQGFEGAVFNPKPVAIYNPAPIYPRIARKKGWEGIVLLKILISQNGDTQDVLIAQSSGFHTLDESAQKILKEWKFTPSRLNGITQTSWATIPIQFKLKN